MILKEVTVFTLQWTVGEKKTKKNMEGGDILLLY